MKQTNVEFFYVTAQFFKQNKTRVESSNPTRGFMKKNTTLTSNINTSWNLERIEISPQFFGLLLALLVLLSLSLLSLSSSYFSFHLTTMEGDDAIFMQSIPEEGEWGEMDARNPAPSAPSTPQQQQPQRKVKKTPPPGLGASQGMTPVAFNLGDGVKEKSQFKFRVGEWKKSGEGMSAHVLFTIRCKSTAPGKEILPPFFFFSFLFLFTIFSPFFSFPFFPSLYFFFYFCGLLRLDPKRSDNTKEVQ